MVNAVGESNTSAVLILMLGFVTQNTRTIDPIFLDFYLPDTLDSRLSQINRQPLTKLLADGNPVMVVIMKNESICYLVENYAVENGKIYAIFPTGWHLIPEQPRLYPFMVLPIHISVP